MRKLAYVNPLVPLKPGGFSFPAVLQLGDRADSKSASYGFESPLPDIRGCGVMVATVVLETTGFGRGGSNPSIPTYDQTRKRIKKRISEEGNAGSVQA